MALVTKLEVFKMKSLKITLNKFSLLSLIFFLFFISCSLNTIFKIEKKSDPTLNNTCTISGYVLDRKTKEPLVGANVILSGSNLGAATDFDGFFLINKIPPRKYDIKVSYIGYKSYTKSNIVLESNYKYTLNVELVFDPW